MIYVIALSIALVSGWSVMACEALFRAEPRPGMFNGTMGMILLLVVAGVGGLLLAGLRHLGVADRAVGLGGADPRRRRGVRRHGLQLAERERGRRRQPHPGGARRPRHPLQRRLVVLPAAHAAEPSAPVDLQRGF